MVVARSMRSLCQGVSVAMGHPPLAGLAAVHLGSPQGVGARLTVDGGRGVLKTGCISHVAGHVVRLQLEGVRRAVGEALLERSKQVVQLILPMSVSPRPQYAHGLIARPQRPSWGRVAVVQGELRFVQRSPDPG